VATVRYLVHNVEEALPFYEALGFTVVERPGPPIVFVKRGDLTLWLSGPASSAARTLPDGSVPKPGGWNRLVIEVDDLAAAMNALRPSGARFRSDPIEGPGGKQVLVDDPSGNPIELFEAAKRN
jgi:catechol 2,3-dioxygenase-like lactoylglutathione lyase family enzyme